MPSINPFTLVRASDYTDKQINELWVELEPKALNEIIEPTSRASKFILGGKGTGKTHILRYFSFPAIQLRSQGSSGIEIISKHKFLAVFLRATNIDSTRFEKLVGIKVDWQSLFGVYLELKFAELVLDALIAIKSMSEEEVFAEQEFILSIAKVVIDNDLDDCNTLNDLRSWVVRKKREIDRAVNNAAFSETLDINFPFSIGGLCITISKAISVLHPNMNVPLIFLLDEIENLTESQQQVVNSLIRYGDGLATFRVTGRLYAHKTLATISKGEENREGSEFSVVYLDDFLAKLKNFKEFSECFVKKRLQQAELINQASEFKLSERFEELSGEDFFSKSLQRLKIDGLSKAEISGFQTQLQDSGEPALSSPDSVNQITELLIEEEFPAILKKLNILLFYKKFSQGKSGVALANELNAQCKDYLSMANIKKTYQNAYGHWATDLFAQMCRNSKKIKSAQYAGLDTLIRLTSSNPRNLLIILGRIYSIAKFDDVDFVGGELISYKTQTEAVVEASRFIFEADTNFGQMSDTARIAVERLGLLLKTARYARNIPEVSPLSISFSELDLSAESKRVYKSALNYSLIFEVHNGRQDRNSQGTHKKIRLNPMLAPRWGLPVSHRGDIAINRELINAIFEEGNQEVFEKMLKKLETKWNKPLSKSGDKLIQEPLF